MSWASDVLAGYELGGRVASELRIETSHPQFIDQLLQQRIDDPDSLKVWPRNPDPDLHYDGEANIREWQYAPCQGERWFTNRGWIPCGHHVHLTQQQASQYVCGETVEVYCSWCTFNLEKGRTTTRKAA